MGISYPQGFRGSRLVEFKMHELIGKGQRICLHWVLEDAALVGDQSLDLVNGPNRVLRWLASAFDNMVGGLLSKEAWNVEVGLKHTEANIVN
jgi:hypothetical protein